MSDNGPQYNSQAFIEFAKQYNFSHNTSSPKFPQANGDRTGGSNRERFAEEKQ